MSLRVGDRVLVTKHADMRGVIDRISPEGIHYRVHFADGRAPNWPQVLDGSCYFYSHELERCSPYKPGTLVDALWNLDRAASELRAAVVRQARSDLATIRRLLRRD